MATTYTLNKLIVLPEITLGMLFGGDKASGNKVLRLELTDSEGNSHKTDIGMRSTDQALCPHTEAHYKSPYPKLLNVRELPAETWRDICGQVWAKLDSGDYTSHSM